MNQRFKLKNNDGISSWVETFYNRYLPDSGLFVEIGVGHSINRVWAAQDTKKAINEQTKIFERCGSNTFELLGYGYSGIYIEPIKEFCDELALITKNKNVKILNLGCSNKAEVIPLYLGETFKQNSQIGNLNMGYTVDYVGRKVECNTLSSILNNLSIDKEIDLMSIDVEGWEMKVLEGIENKHLPKLMIIEINKSAGIHEKLEKKGYVLCHRDDRDAGYVRGDII
jgi:FkbM family methyltransferase